MTRIDYAELIPMNGSWNVRYTSEPQRSEVIRLFGTDMIPTPYRDSKPYEDVRALLNAIPANSRTCFVEGRMWYAQEVN